mmetsp:Transcript_3526/g.3933  ORF Transcript_3526/g.3933 Transcript_3526/m.3933 type:complete len:138 (-) Transcript_3526:85-498(-)
MVGTGTNDIFQQFVHKYSLGVKDVYVVVEGKVVIFTRGAGGNKMFGTCVDEIEALLDGQIGGFVFLHFVFLRIDPPKGQRAGSDVQNKLLAESFPIHGGSFVLCFDGNLVGELRRLGRVHEEMQVLIPNHEKGVMRR